MATKSLPDQALLRQLLDYRKDTGGLIWRWRPGEYFTDDPQHRRWNTRYAGRIAGHTTKAGYVIVIFLGEDYRAHRIIWKWMTGEEPPEVDHRDLNTSNNRWENLRAADHSGNMMNRTDRVTSDHPKGVNQIKGGRWLSRITVKGATHYLGVYDTAAQGYAAYCEAAERLHGEWANLGHGSVPKPVTKPK